MTDLTLSDLGQRICIIGPSSTGKSTLAKALSEKLNTPCCYLDQIAHIPKTDWQRRPDNAFIAEHDSFIKKDHWIVEGNYSICMPQRFARATSVIWTGSSKIGFLWRYCKRSFLHIWKHEPRIGRLEGAKTEFSLAHIKYVLLNNHNKGHNYQDLIHANGSPKVLKLNSFKAVMALYKTWGLNR